MLARMAQSRQLERQARETLRALGARPTPQRATVLAELMGESKDLTAQELNVARLVRQGMSTRDVAGRLFVSPRTVDFHLRNVFTKTGVSSRLELANIAFT